jgi:hypothetical protein
MCKLAQGHPVVAQSRQALLAHLRTYCGLSGSRSICALHGRAGGATA